MKLSSVMRVCAAVLLFLAASGGALAATKKEETRYPNALRTAPKSDLTSTSEQKALQDGLDALNSGDDAKAQELLQKVIDTSKSKYARGIAYEGLGNAKYNSQDFKGAIEDFQKLIELNSVSNDAYFDSMYYIAAAYAADGQHQAALDQLKAWREQGKRETAESYAIEGNSHYQLHQYQEAITAIKKAQSLTDQPKESWNNILLASYAETGQSAQATGVVDAELAKDPNNKQVIRNALVLYIQADAYDKAFPLLEREHQQGLITEESDYLTAARFYANIAQGADKPDAAIKGGDLLQDGLNKKIVKATAENYKLQGDLYLIAQEQQKALAAYTMGSPLASNGDLDYLRAQITGSQQNYAEAKTLVQTAISRGVTKKGKAYLLLGKLDIALGDKAGAKAALQQAQADADTRSEATDLLAKAQGGKK